MRNLMAGALFALSLSTQGYAAIQEEAVTYKDGDTVMKGFIVYDDAIKGKRPGSWWCTNGGASPSTCATRRASSPRRATRRSSPTCTATPRPRTTRKDAGALSGAVRKNPAVMQCRRFNAAKDQLAKHATVDRGKHRRLGLLLRRRGRARHGAQRHRPEGRRGVSRRPRRATAPRAGAVKAKVLVLNGADDPFIKPDSIEAFKKDMDAAKVGLRLHQLPRRGARLHQPGGDREGQAVQPAARLQRESGRAVQGRSGEVLQQRVQVADRQRKRPPEGGLFYCRSELSPRRRPPS